MLVILTIPSGAFSIRASGTLPILTCFRSKVDESFHIPFLDWQQLSRLQDYAAALVIALLINPLAILRSVCSAACSSANDS